MIQPLDVAKLMEEITMSRTLDVLKLLVKTLEQAESNAPFKDVPDDYDMGALQLGKDTVEILETLEKERHSYHEDTP